MEHRPKLTEAELKAAEARLDEIYAPAYAYIEEWKRKQAEAEKARARPKQVFVKPKPKVVPIKPSVPTPVESIANVVEFPPKLSEQELMRRQAILDQHWQAMLDEKALLREEALKRSFHKAPGDPDWNL
jgi:hypothetical protein